MGIWSKPMVTTIHMWIIMNSHVSKTLVIKVIWLYIYNDRCHYFPWNAYLIFIQINLTRAVPHVPFCCPTFLTTFFESILVLENNCILQLWYQTSFKKKFHFKTRTTTMSLHYFNPLILASQSNISTRITFFLS